MKVLITGAGGFIGSRLAVELAGAHEVHALVRAPSSGHAGVGHVKWTTYDLTRPIPTGALPHSIDIVVHLAQSRLHREFPKSSGDLFEVNVGGTQRMLEYARQAGARQFVYASSGGIHGYSVDPVTEESPIDPISYYLTTKYVGELLLKAYRPYFSTVVLRPFFVYGQGQAPYMFMPRLAESIVQGRAIYLRGKNGLRVNPVHVSDAVRAFARSVHVEGHHVINVAGPDVVTLRQLVEGIAAHLERKPIFEPEPGDLTGDLIGDTSRMTALLGPPTVHLKDGLREVRPGEPSLQTDAADG